MTVGLDIKEKGGRRTQEIARAMGGQMIYLNCDLTHDHEMEEAVKEAAKLGDIKCLINNAGIQHIGFVQDFPMERYD